MISGGTVFYQSDQRYGCQNLKMGESHGHGLPFQMGHQHQQFWNMQQNYAHPCNRSVMGQHQNAFQQQADANLSNFLTESFNVLQPDQLYTADMTDNFLEENLDFNEVMQWAQGLQQSVSCSERVSCSDLEDCSVKWEAADSPGSPPADLASCCSSTESERGDDPLSWAGGEGSPGPGGKQPASPASPPAPRRRRPGARRKEELEEDPDCLSSPVEAQKRKRRREQNRVAARRCRERKKEQRQVLVGEYYRLINEKAQLESQNKKMQSEIERLGQLLSNHMRMCGCATTQSLSVEIRNLH